MAQSDQENLKLKSFLNDDQQLKLPGTFKECWPTPKKAPDKPQVTFAADEPLCLSVVDRPTVPHRSKWETEVKPPGGFDTSLIMEKTVEGKVSALSDTLAVN
jgi:hypothetical protein